MNYEIMMHRRGLPDPSTLSFWALRVLCLAPPSALCLACRKWPPCGATRRGQWRISRVSPHLGGQSWNLPFVSAEF